MADSSTGAATQPAATVRDSIAAAITELEPAEVAAEGAAEGTKPEGSETPPATTEAIGERARDAQGRFVAKEGEAAAAETATKETKPAGEKPAGEKPATEKSTAAAATDPPQHWSAEDKAFVQKLPAEVRAEYIDRFKRFEAGFTPKLQRAAALEKDYGDVDKHFEPYLPQMTAQGWTKSSLIKAWADVELALAQDAPAQIRKIAEHYNVDLRKLVDGAASVAGTGGGGGGDKPTLVPTGEQPSDPHVKALMDELAQLKGQVTGFTQAEQRRANEAQNAATQKTLTEIQAFAEAKGEDGQPSHPHFADVLNDMLVMAQAERAAGRVPVLKDLYDRAVWANPQTRAKQTAAIEAKVKADAEAAQRKQAADARARAEAARKAGSSVTGAPSGSGQALNPKSKGSLRQDILAAAEEASG